MTRIRNYLFLCFVVVTLCLSSGARAENIEQSMTADEFKAAGLDKLSADELARLNQWLANKNSPSAQATATAASPAATTVDTKPVDNGPPIAAKYRSSEERATMPSNTEVHSRIVGYFNGWHKNAIFKLENGQHWRVTDDRRYHSSSVDAPAVTIEPGFMGAWYLSIDGSNRNARVERVK